MTFDQLWNAIASELVNLEGNTYEVMAEKLAAPMVANHGYSHVRARQVIDESVTWIRKRG